MPGANPRALDKGRTLAADVLIMDVEDGVLPDAKAEARARIVAELAAGGYEPREVVVRINGIGTDWFAGDVAAFAASGADALLVPKVDGPETVLRLAEQMDATGAPGEMGIWCMLETPLGILNARDTAAAHPRLRAFTLGTADLSKELHADLHAPDRLALLTSIGLVILAARAYGLAVLDAPHFDLDDDAGFERACRQGKSFGFDGKTLLHPKTIAPANNVYGPSAEEIAWSERVIAAWSEAAEAGKGVTLLDGKLIENLHVAEAERVIALAARIAELAAASAR
ncbi:MAG: CoA ester lyase [Gammaproteobacteria bacterium]|nr:CoA ester lyase [Gammaproteobacteria bacterium]